MPYGILAADQIQSSVTGSSIGPGNATRFKNRLINGDMRIDQRNAGASVATSSGTSIYTLDRWLAVYSATSKYTVQQNAGSVTPPAGFINYLGVTSSSAYSIGAGDYFYINQRIEGLNVADLSWGTINAKTVTVSAWVYSSLTGTFGGAIRNSATDRSYAFTYTISSANTWTQISVTIPGDTTGTWLTTNGTGLQIAFSFGVGSTYSTAAGAWTAGNYGSATGATSVVGTNGATWYITGVQLEVGSIATGFEYVNYGVQLAQCQRYFVNIPANFEAIAYYSDRLTNGMLFFPVTMRTAPTSITGGGWTAHTGNAGTYATTSATANYVRQYNSANNWTVGAICTLSAAVLVSAEL